MYYLINIKVNIMYIIGTLFISNKTARLLSIINIYREINS